MTYSTRPLGSVFVDGITIMNACKCIMDNSKPHTIELISLANFLETLVLHDTIFIDQTSISEYYPEIVEFISDLNIHPYVKIIDIDRKIYIQAKEMATKFSENLDFTSMCSKALKLYPSLKGAGQARKGVFTEEAFYILDRAEFSMLFDKDFLPFLTQNKRRRTSGTDHETQYLLVATALKAWLYLSVSLQIDLIYIPNDIRAIFLEERVSKRASITVMRKLEQVYQTVSLNNSQWLGNRPYYEETIKFPLIFNYIASRANSRKELIDLALDLRSNNSTTRFRNKCAVLDDMRRKGEVSAIASQVKDLEAELTLIANKYNISDSFEITISLSPEISLQAGTIKTIYNRWNLSFLREIFDGTTDPQKITSSMNRFWE